jgi:hypothetical protein
MKVTGPDSGSPPGGAADAGEAAGAPGAAAPAAAAAGRKAVEPLGAARVEGAPTSGELFAEKLAATQAPPTAQATAPGASGQVAATGSVVSPDIAAGISSDLAAGRLSPQAAVDKVVEQVLSRQLGPDAPAAVREQVRAALQEALASDPLLADKLRRLGVATPET